MTLADQTFTQAALRLLDLMHASMKATPFTPSSTVGKITSASGLAPERAAMMALAASE